MAAGLETRVLLKPVVSEADLARASKAIDKSFRGLGSAAKRYQQPLGRITGQVTEFGKSLEASNARVLAFGASAGVIYKITQAFDFLVKSTIDVEKTLKDINVILNASSTGIKKFGDELFSIAAKTGQSFQAVGAAATEFSRQGLGMEKTLKRTNDALVLARLSGMDTVEATNALTAAVNSFSSAALNTTQIVNKLATVDAAFAVSSTDLAEAIKRSGASAEAAGVSFDQLLGIVTAVQERTARGGAVIGNSLKTIFTRISRPAVLEQLRSLGIEIRTLHGDIKPTMDVLQQLANRFDTLSDSQRSQISQMVGGVFQVNNLKAALKDLGSEYSRYKQAVDIASRATNEAQQRNEALNDTLSARLNKTLARTQQLAAGVGDKTLQPVAGRVLDIVSLITPEPRDTEDTGYDIGSAIMTGIGNFLKGPGLIAMGAIAFRLFKSFAKFAGESLKQVIQMGSAKEKTAQIEARLKELYMTNRGLMDGITKGTMTRAQHEQDVLEMLLAQEDAMQRMSGFARSAAGGGKSPISKAIKRMHPKGAAGFIPTASHGFVPQDAAMAERAGAFASGYTPGQVRSTNISGIGKVVYNTREKIKQFPGMSQPAIIPPAGSKAGARYRRNFRNVHGFTPMAGGGFPGHSVLPSDFGDTPGTLGFPSGRSGRGRPFPRKRGISMAGHTRADYDPFSFSTLEHRVPTAGTGKLSDPMGLSGASRKKLEKVYDSIIKDLKKGNVDIKRHSTALKEASRSLGLTKESRRKLMSTYEVAAEKQTKINLAADKELQAKESAAARRQQRNQMLGLGLSMVAPMALAGIEENFKRRGIGMTGSDITFNNKLSAVTSAVGSGISTGAMGGMMTGGPWGAGIGAAVGVAMEAPSIWNAWSDILPEVNFDLEVMNSRLTEASENIGNFERAVDAVNKVLTGQVKDPQKVANSFQQLIISSGASGAEAASRYITSGGMDKGALKEIRDAKAVELTKHTEAQQTQSLLTDMTKFTESAKVYSESGMEIARGLVRQMMSGKVGGETVLTRFMKELEKGGDEFVPLGEGRAFKRRLSDTPGEGPLNEFDPQSGRYSFPFRSFGYGLKTFNLDQGGRSIEQKYNPDDLFRLMMGKDAHHINDPVKGALFRAMGGGQGGGGGGGNAMLRAMGYDVGRGDDKVKGAHANVGATIMMTDAFNEFFHNSLPFLAEAIKNMPKKGEDNRITMEEWSRLFDEFVEANDEYLNELKNRMAERLVVTQSQISKSKADSAFTKTLMTGLVSDRAMAEFNFLGGQEMIRLQAQKSRAGLASKMMGKFGGLRKGLDPFFTRAKDPASIMPMLPDAQDSRELLNNISREMNALNDPRALFGMLAQPSGTSAIAGGGNKVRAGFAERLNILGQNVGMLPGFEKEKDSAPRREMQAALKEVTDGLRELNAISNKEADDLSANSKKFAESLEKIKRAAMTTFGGGIAGFEEGTSTGPALRYQLNQLQMGRGNVRQRGLSALENLRMFQQFGGTLAGLDDPKTLRNIGGGQAFDAINQRNQRMNREMGFGFSSAQIHKITETQMRQALKPDADVELARETRDFLASLEERGIIIRNPEELGREVADALAMPSKTTGQKKIKSMMQKGRMTKAQVYSSLGGVAGVSPELAASIEDHFEQLPPVHGGTVDRSRATMVPAGKTNLKVGGRAGGSMLTSMKEGFFMQEGANFVNGMNNMGAMMNDLAGDMREGFKSALKEAMFSAESLSDALRAAAVTILDKLSDKVFDVAFNSMLNAMGNKFGKGGYVKGYASGGLVQGGSGFRDDVPAMLSQGEFVIRKSAVDKYGASNLNAMNLQGGGGVNLAAPNTLIPNDRKRPTDFTYNISPRLSALAVTDESRPDVARRRQAAEAILRNRMAHTKAMQGWKAQQRGRLIQAYSSAAMMFAAHGLSGGSWETGLGKGAEGSGGPQGFMGNPYRDTGNMGGFIGSVRRGYASGGYVDNVPAMLMGGEMVMNRDAVNQYGRGFFEKINKGQVEGMAEGGLVGGFASTGSPASSVDLFDRLIESTDALKSSIDESQFGKNNPDSSAPSSSRTQAESPTFNITINASVDQAGRTNSDTQTSSTGRTDQNDSNGDSERKAIAMSESIRTACLDVILNEKRPGGALSQHGVAGR